MNAQIQSLHPLPSLKIRRILYATDFSEAATAALPLVSEMARKYGAQVVVAHVCYPIPYTMVPTETAEALKDKDFEEAETMARTLLSTPELRDLSTVIDLEHGNPSAELARIVAERDIDLAIVSTHGRTGFQHFALGSVTEQLFRSLSCPVLTVGPGFCNSAKPAGVSHILFPTDLSEESQAFFPYVAAWASDLRASLSLLHVLPLETATNPDARQLAEPWRDEMRKIFSPSIGSLTQAEFLIDFGDAAERIVANAASHGSGLIALSARRAAGIVTHFRQTVAYRVVLEAPCPVLVGPAEPKIQKCELVQSSLNQTSSKIVDGRLPAFNPG